MTHLPERREVSDERKIDLYELHETTRNISDSGFHRILEYAQEIALIESIKRGPNITLIKSIVCGAVFCDLCLLSA
jgi:hypothetical protein